MLNPPIEEEEKKIEIFKQNDDDDNLPSVKSSELSASSSLSYDSNGEVRQNKN